MLLFSVEEPDYEYLEEENIAGLKPHDLFMKGVLRTFQIAHEFSTLTVLKIL